MVGWFGLVWFGLVGWLVGWLVASLIPVATGFPDCTVKTKSVPVPFLFVKYEYISEVTCLGKMLLNPSYVKLLLPGISLNDRKVVEELSVI